MPVTSFTRLISYQTTGLARLYCPYTTINLQLAFHFVFQFIIQMCSGHWPCAPVSSFLASEASPLAPANVENSGTAASPERRSTRGFYSPLPQHRLAR